MSEQRVIRSWYDVDTREGFRERGLWGDQTLAELFDGHAEARPDKLAVADEVVRWSYAELRDLSLRIATVLVDLGVEPGDPVAAQLPSCGLLPAVHLAANRIGAILVPLSSTWRSAEVGSLLGAVKPPVLLVPGSRDPFDFQEMVEQIRPQVPSLRHVLTVRGDKGPSSLESRAAEAVPLSAQQARSRRPDPDGPTLAMCSSGTTGMPKASVYGGNDLVALLLHHFRVALELTGEDVAAGLAPANTGATGYAFPVLAPLLAGASSVMLEHWSPEAALDLIVKERCTYATAIPTQMVMMLELPLEQADLSVFTRFNNAGAPLAPATAEEIETRMGCRVQSIYGATDGGVPVMSDVAQSDHARRTTVGRLRDGLQFKLAGADGQPVPQGTAGEACWRGPNKSYGYLNQPEYDALVWDAEGWFHSGDLGEFDEEGNLRIVGRTKDMILRGGTNIFPREVEELLIRHPAVARVSVVGVPDKRLGEKACAVVVAAAGQAPTLADLTEFLLGQGIAKVKLPEYLILTDHLPMNAGGKIDKGGIGQLAVERLTAQNLLN